MILILTFKEYEQSTDPVVDWLLYYKEPFIKIFIEDLLNQSNRYRIDLDNKKIFVEGEDMSSKIKVVFYRRFVKRINLKSSTNLGQITEKINRESNAEIKDLFDYLCYILEDKIWFPHYSNINVNKLTMLNIASEVNLKTPISTITNSKKELQLFIDTHKGVVCKPIRQISYYTFGKYTYSPYTTEITDGTIKKLSDFFFPSLFQAKIKSNYEIRCFYLDGDIYASAIFTHQNENKDVDIKLSFNEKTTKWVSYKLPKEIQTKIIHFMNIAGLNTGSIDLIRSHDGHYYFIEVNPVGQYLAPSVFCNYYIEKKIAKWLIKKNK